MYNYKNEIGRNAMKKIGIVVAMKEEKEPIEMLMSNKKTEEVYNLQFIVGNIGNTECVLVQCGVGKVNAARTTQILIDRYNVEEVIESLKNTVIYNDEVKWGRLLEKELKTGKDIFYECIEEYNRIRDEHKILEENLEVWNLAVRNVLSK